MKNWTLLGAYAIALVSSGAVAGPENDTLTFATTEEIASFDKYYNTDRIGIITSNLIFDQLVWSNPETGDIEPMLATSWEWIDDDTLEFKLREGVTFHNGESFEAEDVVYTLEQAIDPDNPIPAASFVEWIDSVEKVDQMTVRINTDGPFPAALQYLASPIIPVYGKDYYSKVGPKGMNDKPIGSGPYRVTETKPGESVRFEANEDYWKGGPRDVPEIGTLVLRTIPDKNTQAAELMSGGVDWIWKVPPDQGEALKSYPGLTVEAAPTMRIGYLQMDAAGRSGEDNPLTNQRVRQAVAYAINREAIVKGLLGDGGEVMNSFCYPSQFGCSQDVKTYEYDPERARELLAEAGYEDGFSVKLDAYRNRPLVEAIIGNLREVGIDANLNYGRYATIRDEVRAGDSAMNFMTWGSNSINDVSAIAGNFFEGTADDTAEDEKVQKWLKKADTTIDSGVRKKNYAKALQRISKQMYALPLWSYPYIYAYTDELNFTPYPDEIPRFELASWESDS